MTDARNETLASIRRALGVHGGEAPRRATVGSRLEQAPPGPVPRRGSEGDRLAIFRAEAERAHATVVQVSSPADVPAEVERFLRDNDLPCAVRMGADEALAALPWTATATNILIGPSAGRDLTAVSHAFAAAAETGALVLVGGPDNPTTLNFLPDNHIVVIHAGDVVEALETIWSRLRSAFGKGRMPRTVNLVTGPSRSADIEQTMLLGAHGPRRLHVILVEHG